MVALNVESFDGKDFEESDVTRTGFSFSRDYEMLTVQICLIGTYLCFYSSKRPIYESKFWNGKTAEYVLLVVRTNYHIN